MPARPAPLTDLAAWLAGEWTVTRTINAGAGGFTGTACFTPGDDVGVVTWHERGRLTFGDYSGPAYRTLLLTAADPSGGWRVAFDDGRPFHALDLRSGHAEPEHVCGADLYRGRFDVLDADRFVVTWRVTGPGRDDVIATDYRRGGVTPLPTTR